MFEINSNLEVRETSSTPTIPVGINDNVMLVSVTKEKDKNSNSYLQFLFKGSEGAELKHNEFSVNPDYITPKPGETIDQAMGRKVNSMLIRIKHICTKFISADAFTIKADSFDGLCDAITGKMNTADLTKKVRLKVVYNYKDYASVPNFCPFIEDMTIANSGLKINPTYDKMEKATATSNGEVEETDNSQLPF
tara:strand:+ start:5452 stop:6030 length:579 start_codon:yes stop_codon:yes gene_type:complete